MLGGATLPHRAASAIYVGTVRHRRHLPRPHAFSYRVFMMYLDLDELPTLFDGRWLWGYQRRAPAAFHRADYFGDPSLPLAESIRRLVAERTGVRPSGPIRLLTHLRYFGYAFNPVSFYYCFDRAGAAVETIVAEITNTPWHERHCYVLGAGDNVGSTGKPHYRFAKTFHVSPFLGLDFDYDWRFVAPGEHLAVHMENRRGGARWFDATLTLSRRAIDGASLARTLGQFPLMTATVVAAIHWQAARLWLKRIPVVDHP